MSHQNRTHAQGLLAGLRSSATVRLVIATEIARRLANEFAGSLSEKDALAAYLERTLGNKHVAITAERIEYYHRLGVNYVRGLSRPQPAFG